MRIFIYQLQASEVDQIILPTPITLSLIQFELHSQAYFMDKSVVLHLHEGPEREID